MDLRERVVSYVNDGHSRRQAAGHFGVSPSFAVKLLSRRAGTGSSASACQGRPKGGGKFAPHMAYLIAQVEARPDITIPELADMFAAAHGIRTHPASLWRLLCGAGFSYKKTLLASECERADVHLRRRVWIKMRQPWMRLDPSRLVFIDETSLNTKMTRPRGRSRRGARLRATTTR
jgi:transposase